MARKREELGEAPTPEELLAYRDGRLDPAARESLEARIAVYPEAARALADLAAFPDIPPGPGARELSEQEMDASWDAFRQKLEKLPRPTAPPARAPVDTVPAPRPLRWQWAAAAVLFLSIGLGIGYLLGTHARPAPAAAVQASLNPAIVQLDPLGDDGLRASAEPVELGDDAGELLLVLVLPGTEEHPGYAAEILDAESRALWSGGGLRPTKEGTVRFSLPRGAFPSGTYQIRLFSQGGQGRRAVGRYELRVALTPGPSPTSGRGE